MTLSEALALATQHHQAGRLPEAEHLYRQILQAQPNQADALHLLGVIACQVGRPEIAVEYIGRAIALNGNVAEPHYNLGKALHTMHRDEEAAASYRRALQLKPGLIEARCNLGVIFSDEGNLEEAAACFRQVLELRPNHADAHSNLGHIFTKEEKLDEAVAAFHRAIELNPNLAEAHNNLGNALKDQGKLYEALAAFRRAVALKPDFTSAHNDLGLILLQLGQYEEGWREYEYRAECSATPRTFAQPRWKGERVDGRTILLHSQQGFGDVLQFARYVPLIRRSSGAWRVILEAHPGLLRLLAANGGWEADIVPEPAAGETVEAPFDHQIPLLSLPLALGLHEPLPMTDPYLRADPELRQAWRERLGGAGALRVGLVWAGNAAHKLDRIRSMRAETFLPLLQIPGIDFYSLQIGPASGQAQPLLEAGLIDLTAHITDFADTAAFLAELDLLISVDTAVVHLAGAMGRPVWTLTPTQPEWRWGLTGEQTPWYPTMRLFRHGNPANWDAVIANAAEALRLWAESQISNFKSQIHPRLHSP